MNTSCRIVKVNLYNLNVYSITAPQEVDSPGDKE